MPSLIASQVLPLMFPAATAETVTVLAPGLSGSAPVSFVQTITLTDTISGAPTGGTVIFTLPGGLGSTAPVPVVGGVATTQFTIPFGTPATAGGTVTATYSGTPGFAGSTSSGGGNGTLTFCLDGASTLLLGSELQTFAVLGGAGVTNGDDPPDTTTVINGNVGTPLTAASVTGFNPTGIVLAPSTIVAGPLSAAATAETQLVTDITTLDGKPPGPTQGPAVGPYIFANPNQDLSGLTLTPGVYKFNSAVTLNGTLTLNDENTSNAVFVFQIPNTLMTSATSRVQFINGGADNVYWVVGSSATLGGTASVGGSRFAGNILALTSIQLDPLASIACGRALAETASVTLIDNFIDPAPTTSIGPSGTIVASSGYDRPTFNWTAGAGADHYYLAVVDNNTGAEPIVVPSIIGTSYVATAAQALTPGHAFTIYLYTVRANGQYSLATQTFTLAALPAPTGLTPNSTIVAANGYDRPTFSWIASPGADHYYLIVVDNTTGAEPIVVPNVSGTSYVTTTTQALTPGHSFTTYVYAISSNSQAYTLARQTFTLAALPAPTNATPGGTVVAAGGYDKPTFSWTASPGADHYYLIVMDNTTGAESIVVPNVSGTSYATTTTQALTPGHSFTTYVYAISSNSQAYTLARQTFTLAALPAPTNVMPSGTVVAAGGYDRPTFSWTASPGADHYYLIVMDNTTGAESIVVPNVSGTSYVTTTQALTPGHSFTTYVYAISSNSQAYTLARQAFTLGPP